MFWLQITQVIHSYFHYSSSLMSVLLKFNPSKPHQKQSTLTYPTVSILPAPSPPLRTAPFFCQPGTRPLKRVVVRVRRCRRRRRRRFGSRRGWKLKGNSRFSATCSTPSHASAMVLLGWKIRRPPERPLRAQSERNGTIRGEAERRLL